MSMIAPNAFIIQYQDYKYEELLPVRDELIEDIKAFEEEGDYPASMVVCPSPAVRYQCKLEYLAELLKLIAEKYREERAAII